MLYVIVFFACCMGFDMTASSGSDQKASMSQVLQVPGNLHRDPSVKLVGLVPHPIYQNSLSTSVSNSSSTLKGESALGSFISQGSSNTNMSGVQDYVSDGSSSSDDLAPVIADTVVAAARQQLADKSADRAIAQAYERFAQQRAELEQRIAQREAANRVMPVHQTAGGFTSAAAVSKVEKPKVITFIS